MGAGSRERDPVTWGGPEPVWPLAWFRTRKPAHSTTP
jgi:hypothetical protein